MKNQSLALGVDKTLSPSLLADFRFGWFEYDVNVLPADFGTTPAADAGIPNLNFDTTFTSGLPSLFIGGDNSTAPSAFEMGMGLEVNRCNCPLVQNEKQWQLVGNLTKLLGNHSFKFGIDVRRAYRSARAVGLAPLRRADIQSEPHLTQWSRRPRLGHVPAG